MYQRILLILISLLVVSGGNIGPVQAESIKIASYNVENLFDLHFDGTEYPDYTPGGPTGWEKTQLDIKLDNISSVIKDLDADIIALQEVESEKALALLNNRLSLLGVEYLFSAIATQRLTPVRCAVLSRFSISGKDEILAGKHNERVILKVQVDIEDNLLTLYVNHWKSKAGPESKRMRYAAALAADIEELACDDDFILIGDFNSDYNEYETFKHISRLNDTRGITGINHVVRTLKDDEMVKESFLTEQKECGYLYNLWLEVPENRRWSVNFFGRKNSPDSIIISKGLYDSKGISYVDNSFDKYDPDYLFDNNKVFRWQRADRGKGRHLGKGYSDHLPVFAIFTTRPFLAESQHRPIFHEPVALSIAGLYNLKKGPVNVRIHEGAVIYKDRNNAVIKEKNGRAIYIYKVAKELEYQMVYGLTVTHLNRHYGNLEITGIKDIEPLGRKSNLDDYFIDERILDFKNPHMRNEVIETIKGVYENGWLHFGDDQKVRLYFSDTALKPKNFSLISLSNVRIGYHRHPEIIVEKKEQVSIQ